MNDVDVVCLSHLRWDFVYQRPQHLLTRCSREQRVFFVEEPHFEAIASPRLDVQPREGGLRVVIPHLPEALARSDEEVAGALRQTLDDLFREHGISRFLLWYYTPMAVPFTRHLKPLGVIYDCMDELSAFRGAPPAMTENEQELLRRADVVFTGGQSLYEAKRGRHPNVHAFPSSIDAAHFAQARVERPEPRDQASIPHPRLGYFGVIDERMDLDLLDAIAAEHPEWHLVMVGPVVKIETSALPRRPNIHYLGGKNYTELPDYLAGWSVALLPFANNESTRFISPTKTPEYLAAGKPVISAPIRDVVRPYGEGGFVKIACTPAEFIAAIEELLSITPEEREAWLERVDLMLSGMSWDSTWSRMLQLLPIGAGASPL